MAMNKKERAELEEAKKAVRLAKAFSWPIGPKPKRMEWDDSKAKQSTTRKWNLIIRGWHAHFYGHEYRVEEGCFSRTGHSSHSTKDTSSQGQGRFFATRLEALIMCRHEMTQGFAERLAALDAEIEAEQTKEEACGNQTPG